MWEPGGQGLELVEWSHWAHQLLTKPYKLPGNQGRRCPRAKPIGIPWGPSGVLELCQACLGGAWNCSPCTAGLLECRLAGTC